MSKLYNCAVALLLVATSLSAQDVILTGDLSHVDLYYDGDEKVLITTADGEDTEFFGTIIHTAEDHQGQVRLYAEGGARIHVNPEMDHNADDHEPFSHTSGTSIGTNSEDTRSFLAEEDISVSRSALTEVLASALAPVPARETLRLQTSSAMRAYTIYDLQGRLVRQVELAPVRKHELSVAQLSAGTYIMRLLFEDGSVSNQKFVKQ